MYQKGTVIQSLAPVRRDPSHRTEMISQLFFGDTFSILQNVKGWYRIGRGSDGITGWLEDKYFVFNRTEESSEPQHVLSAPGRAKALSGIQKKEVPLFPGTYLNTWHPQQRMFTTGGEKWTLLQGDPVPVPEHPGTGQIIQTAELFSGCPYLWGGVTTAGIDCSGFVQTVFRINGIMLPHSARIQAEAGTEVHFLEKARAGDLVFFSRDDHSGITHAGILTSTKEVIHVSGSVCKETIDPEGIFDPNRESYGLRLRLIKRILQDNDDHSHGQ